MPNNDSDITYWEIEKLKAEVSNMKSRVTRFGAVAAAIVGFMTAGHQWFDASNARKVALEEKEKAETERDKAAAEKKAMDEGLAVAREEKQLLDENNARLQNEILAHEKRIIEQQKIFEELKKKEILPIEAQKVLKEEILKNEARQEESARLIEAIQSNNENTPWYAVLTVYEDNPQGLEMAKKDREKFSEKTDKVADISLSIFKSDNGKLAVTIGGAMSEAEARRLTGELGNGFSKTAYPQRGQAWVPVSQ